MPEAYHSTKMMLARAKNAADRAGTAAEHAARNLSPRATEFRFAADMLRELFAAELAVAINERAIVAVTGVAPAAEATAVAEAAPTVAEDGAITDLPTGDIGDAEVDETLAEGPEV